VELHPLARQFASVADSYEQGRPEYSLAVIGATAAELGIGPGDPVLDLAAGTGKLTRVLVAYGFEVLAVEPQEPLREVLAEKASGARVIDGVAEQIPLEDRSVAAVMIADAFHWFDRPRALQEIRRVLRPGGGLALFNTVPDWSGASWAHELGTLVVKTRPTHPNFDGRSWQEFVREVGCFAEPWELRVTTYAPADTERVITHMASISWIAGMPDAEREDVLEQMRSIIAAGETPARFGMHFEVGLTRLLDGAAGGDEASRREQLADVPGDLTL
jgi:ubiquinone/menaquinone biosynthesis C-methylase UbiE